MNKTMHRQPRNVPGPNAKCSSIVTMEVMEQADGMVSRAPAEPVSTISHPSIS